MITIDKTIKIGVIIFLSEVVLALSLYFIFINHKLDDILVPDVVGYDIRVAEEYLINEGFIVTICSVHGDEENKVIDMYPYANSVVKEKSEITLYKAVLHYFMPDLCGQYYSLDIIDGNFYKINVIDVVDNSQPQGTIINQSPAFNEEIKRGDLITLYVVIHDDFIYLENLVGRYLSDVVKYEKENNLSFIYIYVDSIFFEENTVIAQSVSEGAYLIKGANNYIEIYVSRGYVFEELNYWRRNDGRNSY